MSDYTYYPGCSLAVSNRGYDLSTRAVAQALGLGLHELEDWNCCGATAYMSVRELSAFVISARNLALAERAAPGRDLVTVCSACYTVLNKVNHYLPESPRLRDALTKALAAAGLTYSGGITVRHFLDVLVNDVGCETIAAKAPGSLEGLRVAPYYGCQLSRPHGTFDDPEFPSTMDQLLSSLGATVVDYPVKAKCCGGMLMTTSQKVSLTLVRNLLEEAAHGGADCIATACPLCHINLEGYQGKVNQHFNTAYEIPIVYFTQLVGLALGLPEKELGLDISIGPPLRYRAKIAALAGVGR